jgi:hypothetical protein
MRRVGSSWASRWDGFWFRPEAAENLAAARMIVALHALWIVLSRDWAGMAGLPDPFWASLTDTTRARFLMFPGHPLIEGTLAVAAVGALTTFAAGLFPLATGLASALLLYHLAPLETAIWTPSPYGRGLEVSIIALVVLAISPCADAYSVRGSRDSGEPSWRYGWPLRLVQLFVAQIYLFAGYAKLFRVGADWVSADNLRRWILVFNQQDQTAVFSQLGPWIAAHPSLCFLAALGTILLDFGFPLVLFWHRSRIPMLVLATVFHVGILLAMNIAFLNFPLLLVFVNWKRPARDQHHRRREGKRVAIQPPLDASLTRSSHG